jgi:hypothetical protein
MPDNDEVPVQVGTLRGPLKPEHRRLHYPDHRKVCMRLKALWLERLLMERSGERTWLE